MNVTFARKYVRKVILTLLPPHSTQHKAVRAAISKVGLLRPQRYSDSEYATWIKNVESNIFLHADTQAYDERSPLISLVIPFWNTPDTYLNDLMHSLDKQIYKNWELVLVDVSDIPARSAAIKNWADRNNNYTYIKLAKNYDISTNTNKGIEIAIGQYIAFADHDDRLSPFALNEVAHVIQSEQPDIIYSDEDKLTDNGKIRHSPYFKPDWSPHLFLFTNYTNHLSVIKKSLIEFVGGLDMQRNGSQDYDLLLKIHAKSKESLHVVHIPKILYHWREADQSTAKDHTKKAYAFVAGREALVAYFQAVGIPTETSYITNTPGFYKQAFSIDPRAVVKIAVSDRYNPEVKARYLEQLMELTETDLKLSVATTNSSYSNGDFIIEINELCLPLNSSWLDELVGVAALDNVETVSPRLLDSSEKKIVNAGSVSHANFLKFSGYEGLWLNEHTPTGGVWWVRDVDVAPLWVQVRKQRGVSEDDPKRYNVVWSHVDFKTIDS